MSLLPDLPISEAFPDDTRMPPPESRTISIRVPKLTLPSAETAVLLLLIALAGVQTAELLALKRSAAAAPAASSSAGAASAPGANGQLPGIVGSC